jgi:hypothetical protein
VTPKQALAFVEQNGIVLQAGGGARRPVPSFAEFVAGAPIRGSWWGHPKGHEIFRLAEAVSENADVLVCKLVGGKVSYVHRRLWPALVKLAARFRPEQLAKVWNEHTETGAHRARSTKFPDWVPEDVVLAAGRLSLEEAEKILAPWASLSDNNSKAKPRLLARAPKGQ